MDGTTRVCYRCGEILKASYKKNICGGCREQVLHSYRGHKDPEGRAELELFAEEFQYCWLCRWPTAWTEFSRSWRLHIHHIYGGASRKHIRANLSRLCNRCHDLAHDHKLTKEHVLWLKLKHDPGGYDRAALAKIIWRRLPRAAKPTELIKKLRRSPVRNIE